jgi:hypothetical protein
LLAPRRRNPRPAAYFFITDADKASRHGVRNRASIRTMRGNQRGKRVRHACAARKALAAKSQRRGFKSKAEIDKWLASSNREDRLRERG